MISILDDKSDFGQTRVHNKCIDTHITYITHITVVGICTVFIKTIDLENVYELFFWYSNIF